MPIFVFHVISAIMGLNSDQNDGPRFLVERWYRLPQQDFHMIFTTKRRGSSQPDIPHIFFFGLSWILFRPMLVQGKGRNFYAGKCKEGPKIRHKSVAKQEVRVPRTSAC